MGPFGRLTAALSAVVAGAALASAPVAGAAPIGPVATGSAGSAASQAAAPGGALRVRTLMTGLDIPWDLTFLPSGAMLVTERDRERIWLRPPGGGARLLASQPGGVWHGGETGLMAIVADPHFSADRHFYTCHGYDNGRVRDIRVVLWQLNDTATEASRVRPLVTGLPVTSGRHGGCRLRFGRGGALYIATGDAAEGTNPRDLHSLGGKVLRVDPVTGAGWPTNPFSQAKDPDKRRIYTYGHRNVQGLALRPGGKMWSVEHGPDRDDEVNRLISGGDYGWHPVPGYNESVPMTDYDLPGTQLGAQWSSGYPTAATSGATWLSDPRWGRWQGRLAVAALKDSALRIMHFNRAGDFLGVRIPPALNGTYGRLRTAQIGPGGALFLTTSDGGGADRVLRVVPRTG